MFIQLIRGHVADAEGLRSQLDRWNTDVRPGASGFLGSVAGVTPDGTGIAMVRFASEADARANSDRPEQGSWWAETAACYDGEVTFEEGDDTTTHLAGAVDTAGFVQIMVGTSPDRAALEDLEAQAMATVTDVHPAFLGSVTLWGDGGWYASAAYFTSEAEARAGEAAMGANTELMEKFAEMGALSGEVDYNDLPEPWITPA